MPMSLVVCISFACIYYWKELNLESAIKLRPKSGYKTGPKIHCAIFLNIGSADIFDFLDAIRGKQWPYFSQNRVSKGILILEIFGKRRYYPGPKLDRKRLVYIFSNLARWTFLIFCHWRPTVNTFWWQTHVKRISVSRDFGEKRPKAGS